MPENRPANKEVNIDHIPIGEIWEYVYSKKLGFVLAVDKYEGHSTICDRINWNSVVVGGHIKRNSDGTLCVDRYNTQSITEGRTSYVSQTKYPTEVVFSQIIGKYPKIEEKEEIFERDHKKLNRAISDKHSTTRQGD